MPCSSLACLCGAKRGGRRAAPGGFKYLSIQEPEDIQNNPSIMLMMPADCRNRMAMMTGVT